MQTDDYIHQKYHGDKTTVRAPDPNIVRNLPTPKHILCIYKLSVHRHCLSPVLVRLNDYVQMWTALTNIRGC